MKFFLSFIFCLSLSFYVFSQNLLIEDQVYDSNVKTVLLYPERSVLQAPAIPLSQEIPLILEFDMLGSEAENFAVQIVNCDRNWHISQLNQVEYLEDYNEFYIRDRNYSFNTKVSYTHYRFVVPKVKVSGNYLLKVYEDRNESRLILSKRFMVFSEDASVQSALGQVTGVETAFRNQQIDFNIDYSGYDIPNPQEQIKVVIRQNFRWDNAIQELAPTYVQEYKNQLQYKYFNLENSFKGGNEFRMFDSRNAQARGIHVREIVQNPDRNEMILASDLNRSDQIYSKNFEDINGRFFVQNILGKDPMLDSDYVNVVFSLKVPLEINKKVFLAGSFTNWQLKPEFEMLYSDFLQTYQAILLLKQGFYNYQYTLVDQNLKQKDDAFFEGSYFQTENNYEIFVYYRPYSSRSDLLIGYKVL